MSHEMCRSVVGCGGHRQWVEVELLLTFPPTRVDMSRASKHRAKSLAGIP
jgi:hypothetical protein